MDDCKIFAHSDIVREGSSYLKQIMEKSPMSAALERKPDAIKITQQYYGLMGTPLSILLRALYTIMVIIAFTVRRVVSPTHDARKRIVLTDTSVPVVLAALRWIYQIPVHPPVEMLLYLFELATRLRIDRLPIYCIDRLKKEVSVETAAAAAKVAAVSRSASLWKAAVKVGQQHWGEVSHTAGYLELMHSSLHIAQDYALAIHESVVLPAHKTFGTAAA